MRTAREKEPMVMFFGPRVELRRPKKTHAHIEGFNSLVQYLVKLRRDGTLNDEDFGELVKMASAVFVESEISGRVEGVLKNNAVDELLLGFWK